MQVHELDEVNWLVDLKCRCRQSSICADACVDLAAILLCGVLVYIEFHVCDEIIDVSQLDIDQK